MTPILLVFNVTMKVALLRTCGETPLTDPILLSEVIWRWFEQIVVVSHVSMDISVSHFQKAPCYYYFHPQFCFKNPHFHCLIGGHLLELTLLLYHSSAPTAHWERALHRHAGGFSILVPRGTLRALCNATLAVVSFYAPRHFENTLKTPRWRLCILCLRHLQRTFRHAAGIFKMNALGRDFAPGTYASES